MPKYLLKLNNKQNSMSINACSSNPKLMYSLLLNNQILKVSEKFIKSSSLLKIKSECGQYKKCSDGSLKIIINLEDSNFKY